MKSAHKVSSAIARDYVCQEGIYLSSALPDKVSYPEQGNKEFFSIEDVSYWFQHRNECIKAIVQRFGIKGVVLDVGGGNGFVSKMLSGAGLDPILVEPHIQGCMNARERGLKNIICGRLEQLDFSRVKADAIGIFDVLEHVENEDKFLKGINSALSQEGKLLITVPAHSFLWSSADDSAGHYRRYSSKSIKDVLIRNGFKVVFFSYFFASLLVPVFVFRRLPYILSRPKRSDSYKLVKEDYVVSNALLRRYLSRSFRVEIDQIQRKNVLNGTSILVLAEKSS